MGHHNHSFLRQNPRPAFRLLRKRNHRHLAMVTIGHLLHLRETVHQDTIVLYLPPHLHRVLLSPLLTRRMTPLATSPRHHHYLT
jgi:hypothetical protein